MLSTGMLRTRAQSASCASHMYVLLYKFGFKEGFDKTPGPLPDPSAVEMETCWLIGRNSK